MKKKMLSVLLAAGMILSLASDSAVDSGCAGTSTEIGNYIRKKVSQGESNI